MNQATSNPVLVTGGAGYVGAHACKALAARGYQPIVYDNLIYGHEAAVKWGPLEVGDLADRARLDAVIERYRPHAVMHFGAYTFVGESIADPGKYYRNNVVGTLTLLEAMRDHEIDRLVFSSTAATYGTPNEIPIPESAPKMPINPYGHSKLAAEQMIADFSAAHGLRWWEFDVTYLAIRILAWLGLASRIRLPQGTPAKLPAIGSRGLGLLKLPVPVPQPSL